MADKLQNLKEKHQLEEYELLSDEFKQKRRDNALLILGGIRVADKIANSISSQVMNALITFQSEQMYLTLGFDNFVDFLEKSEVSPMTKNQFYKRKEIYELEGGKLFDLMNEIGVSLATRKLLSAGNYDAVTIEGDMLKIGDETADLSNARLVRSLIESYAEDCKRLNSESEKKQIKLEKAEKQITALSNELNSFKKTNDKPEETIIFEAYLQAENSMKNLIKAVKSASPTKREKSADTYIKNLYAVFYAVKEAFGRGSLQLEDSQVEGEFKEILSGMNDDELAGLMK